GPGWTPASFTSRDTLGNRLLAASLASRGSFDIAPYFATEPAGRLREQVIEPTRPGGTVFSPKYPVGTAMLALPFFLGSPPSHVEHASVSPWLGLPVREHVAAAFLAALAAGLFHAFVRRGLPFQPTRAEAFLATAALGLATPFWSANAQALW